MGSGRSSYQSFAIRCSRARHRPACKRFAGRQKSVEKLNSDSASVAPNVFYGTGIPACILVLRGTASRNANRRGKILFINADREFTAGRAQNYLGPQHVEKIVSAYHEYGDIPGFARIVDIAELRENDFNLNIRRYVNNTPPPEPQDVRAHLHGGVPETEVEAHAARFAAMASTSPLLFSEGRAVTSIFRLLAGRARRTRSPP